MRIVAGAWRGRALVAPPGQGTRPTADRARQALFDMLMHAEWGGRAAIEGAVVLDVFAGTGALGLEALSRGAASACFIESDAAALKALRANVAACRAEDRAKVVAADALRVPAIVSWRGDRAREGGLARPPTTYGAGGGQAVDGRAKAQRNQDEGPRGARPPPMPAHAATGGPDKAGHDDETTGPRPSFSIAVHYPVSYGAEPGHNTGTAAAASLVFLDPPYAQDLVPRAIAHLHQKGYIAPGALIVAETGRDETWLPDQPLLAERRYGAARMLVFRTSPRLQP